MKYLILSLSLLGLSSCSYVRWVTVNKDGQVINENKRPLSIVGNPQMECYDDTFQLVAKGYFVRQQNDGSFLIDEYGKYYKIIENPNCLLGQNE